MKTTCTRMDINPATLRRGDLVGFNKTVERADVRGASVVVFWTDGGRPWETSTHFMTTVMRPGEAMSTTEARKVFDAIISETTDPDQCAMRELLREYFCNPAFRAALGDMCAESDGAPDAGRQ